MKRRYMGLGASVGFLVAAAAQASSVDVSVAYADNLRASGFFPTPWLDGSGVVSQTPVSRDWPTAPIISFTENGTTLVSFTDTGHVLNTGGWDVVNNGAFGGDSNESINSNLVGSQPDRGGTSVPEPGTLSLLGLGLTVLGFMRRRRTP